jgi:hypothetical protein
MPVNRGLCYNTRFAVAVIIHVHNFKYNIDHNIRKTRSDDVINISSKKSTHFKGCEYNPPKAEYLQENLHSHPEVLLYYYTILIRKYYYTIHIRKYYYIIILFTSGSTIILLYYSHPEVLLYYLDLNYINAVFLNILFLNFLFYNIYRI